MSSPAPNPAHADNIAAVSALVATHGPRLHALALRLCRNRADADDLAQQVFLTALRRWHTFAGRSDPGTWLYTIAVRACKRARGLRAGRRPSIAARTVPFSQVTPFNERQVTAAALAAGGSRPDNLTDSHASIRGVQRAISQLPEHLRTAVVLKEVAGLTIEQVSQVLGIEQGTIKTRLHRARLALRKALLERSRLTDAPAPIYQRQVCLDLLAAKLNAMDAGRDARAITQREVCQRCRAVFAELDVVADACAKLGEERLPARLTRAIRKALTQKDQADSAGRARRRGPKPKAARGLRGPVARTSRSSVARTRGRSQASQ